MKVTCLGSKLRLAAGKARKSMRRSRICVPSSTCRCRHACQHAHTKIGRSKLGTSRPNKHGCPYLNQPKFSPLSRRAPFASNALSCIATSKTKPKGSQASPAQCRAGQ